MATVKLQPGDDFAKALDQLPAGSELWLPRGAVFETNRTATIRRDEVRIAAYGNPTSPPPLVRSRACGGLHASGRKNVTVSGIRFECPGTPVDQALTFQNTRRLVLEDLEITGYTFGVVVQGDKPGDCADVTIRRCHIHDNWHPTRKHSAGLYAARVDGLLLEHNFFDTNGWRPGPGGALPTDQNHNCYLQSTNAPAVVRGNVFANASGYGLQQRCGGVCEGNFFLDNPIHQSYGLIHGAPGFPGGVTGVVRGNIYVGSRDLGGSPRGWALEFANILDVEVADLLIAHDRQGNAIAVQVNVPQRVLNPQDLVGVVDLRIRPTVFVWDWPKGKFWKNGSITTTATGMKKLGRLTLPDKWDPPVKADLTKIVTLATVRAIARDGMPLTRLASELIRACRAACGLGETAPTPTPTPVVRLALLRGANVVTDDLQDGDHVSDDCGVVAHVVSRSVAAVRFDVDGAFVREERTAPLSLGGDEGPANVKPFDFPTGPFVLAVELLDPHGAVIARRELTLVGDAPPADDGPDVPGALASAVEAKSLLPTDPIAALAKVERVIELLT